MSMEMWVAFGKSEDLGLAKRFLVRTYVVKATPALEIDTSPMVLDGPRFYLAPAPYTPPFNTTAYLHDKAHRTREARGGIPPYRYSSSNSNVASVDPDTGHVITIGNGIARISVHDKKGTDISYEVKCENVYELVYSGQLRNHTQTLAWMASIGAQLFPDNLMLNSNDPIIVAACFSFQKINGAATQYWCTSRIDYGSSNIPASGITRVTGKQAQWQTQPYVAGIIYVGHNEIELNNPSLGYRKKNRA